VGIRSSEYTTDARPVVGDADIDGVVEEVAVAGAERAAPADQRLPPRTGRWSGAEATFVRGRRSSKLLLSGP
jgi:hypothetical protein